MMRVGYRSIPIDLAPQRDLASIAVQELVYTDKIVIWCNLSAD